MSRTLVCTLQTMNLVLSMYTILVPIVIRLSIWKFEKKKKKLIIVEKSYVFSLMAVSPGETEDTDFNLRLRSFIDMNSNFSGPLTHFSYVVDDLL